MNRWNEDTIHHVYDSVLVGSILELREALELLDSNGVSTEGHYVSQIREGLRVMEQEMDRRGLRVEEWATQTNTTWARNR